MTVQWPQGVWANFKERVKCLYPLRYWPSERRRNSPKKLRPGELSPADAGWPGACVAARLQVMPVRLGPPDMLSRRALTAGHFELNHWQAIPVRQHYRNSAIKFAM
jgi:hypothetical protein